MEQPTVVGDRVFTYWTKRVDTDPNRSAWLLVFYGMVSFPCFTVPGITSCDQPRQGSKRMTNRTPV
jgi:hypothetical protein